MRKVTGYCLMILGMLVFWSIQIGIGIYGIFYIIKAFIEGSILAGIIAIPITAICVWITHLILGTIAIPYSALVSSLLGTEKRQRELWERQRKEQEAEMLGAEDLKWQSETRKTLAKLGMTTQEIEDEVIKHDEEIGKDLVESFRNENKPELAKKEIEQLRALIKYHKHRYYNLDSPEISDVAYDYLKQRLRLLEEAYPQFATQHSK